MVPNVLLSLMRVHKCAANVFSRITSTHLMFNLRARAAICNVNVLNLRCHPLPVTLAVQKHPLCCLIKQTSIYIILTYNRNHKHTGLWTSGYLTSTYYTKQYCITPELKFFKDFVFIKGFGHPKMKENSVRPGKCIYIAHFIHHCNSKCFTWKENTKKMNLKTFRMI